MSLISKKDKIFVAGGTGMVGRAIIRRLILNGYGNILTPKRSNLDLTDFNSVSNWFKSERPDIVVLAAAKVGGIFANTKNPTNFLLDNLKIQNNVIENSWLNNTKRLLFLGSSCIYPKNSKQPIKEEELLTSQLEKTNEYYAIAKISGIKLCQALRSQYGFDSICLMPTNLYGRGDNYHEENSHVLPALINKFHCCSELKKESISCWGSGRPRREFLHVDDLAEACLFSLEKWNPNSPKSPKDKNGETLNLLNVGTGSDISIKDLANTIAKITNFKGEIFWDKSKPDGTFQKLLDITRLKQLGWEAKINLYDGLEKTYKDYIFDKKNNDLRKN